MSAATIMTPAAAAVLHQAVEQFSESAAEPLHFEQHHEQFTERALRDVTINTADVSAMLSDPSNPHLVREEMQAQKDYFRRLKFTYIEQEAKRSFLASITGQPENVQPQENEELEEINAEKKQSLKALKEDIHRMGDEAVALAEQNVARNIVIKKRLAEAQSLQKQIREAELELARIKAKHPTDNRLTIPQANEILEKQETQFEQVLADIETNKQRVTETSDEVKRTAKEVSRLNNDRAREEARAKEVQEGREAGDTKVDDLCRWLSSSMDFYMTLMGIQSIHATAEGSYQLLHLAYDVLASQEPVTLVLQFQTASKRFVGAKLVGSDIDISRQVDAAVKANDVPGLVGDVLSLLRAPVV